MFCFNDFDPKMFRFLRFLICLILVLCILVNCSPLRARATSVALPFVGASVAVSAPVVIGAVVIACGLYLASDAGSAAFNNLVSSISDGLDSAYTYVSDAGEKFIKCLSIEDHYYIPSSLASDVLSSIQSSSSVKEYLGYSCDSFTISDFSTVLSSSLFLENFHSGKTHCFVRIKQYYTPKLFLFDSLPSSVSSDSYSFPVGTRYTFWSSDDPSDVFSTTWNSNTGGSGSLVPVSIWQEFTSSVSGLSADIGQNLDDEKYSTWLGGAVTPVDPSFFIPPSDSGEESKDMPFVPVVFPDDDKDITTVRPGDITTVGTSTVSPDKTVDLDVEVPLIQENLPDVLPGTGVETGVGTAPVSDFLSWLYDLLIRALQWLLDGIQALISWLVDTLLAGIIDVLANLADLVLTGVKSIFLPTFDPAVLTVDLTTFFPFCIPFDLFKMLACLDADPVAPVFNFAIPFLGGRTYEFEIELSAWDEVAATVRMFEVVAFCIGLTVATRKFIKW